MGRKVIRMGSAWMVGMLIAVAGRAAVANGAGPPPQALPGEAYIVQANDSLTKIADKYYGNPQEYPKIVEATNARAGEDASFASIANPNLIVVGAKLWIPPQQGAGLFTVGQVTFEAVAIEPLGLQTVVPAVWPRAEGEDPLFKYAWRAGPFSLVSFTSTPGNEAKSGVARLLGVNKEDLSGGLLGGELTERQVGERSWTIYSREERGITGVVAASVEQKSIYQISLFAASSQQETILQTILQNFEIVDPAAVQQRISVSAPVPGTTLREPFELRGTTGQYPFRGLLLYRVLDAEGNQVGRGPFEVVGRLGSPANFAVAANYRVASNTPGTVEVAEVSMADGTIIAIDSVAVELVADPAGYVITIDDPSPFAGISSPVQIRGKTERNPENGTLNYRLVDASGQQISSGFFQASGPLGGENLFDGFADFSSLQDGPGRVEVFDVGQDGSILAIGTVNVWLTATP